MKKILALILALVMILALAACGDAAAPAETTDDTAEPETTETTETETNETAEEQTAEEPAAEAAYKLGMGIVVSTDSSDTNNAQVDATVAAVVLDADGKIVACYIDCAQNKMDVTDGQVNAEQTFLTKEEKGDDYNMVKFSDATLEWYQQADNFEAYCIGKTADEVLGIETTVNEEGHTVAVDEALYASCSISISDFQEAVAKACNDEQGMTFSASEFKLGVACITTAEESTAATADADGVVKMYTDFGAVVVDANGVVLASLTDAIQPQIAIGVDGSIVSATFKGTKRELKEDYNMVKFSDATLEWYEQAANFEQYTVGKTAAELEGVETMVNEEGHEVFVDEELFASCSISIDGLTNVIVKAIGNAK